MRIGALSEASGIDVETIRYYEKAGLLPKPARHPNSYRDFDHSHLERLIFIKHCRSLDMSLAHVKRLLDLIAHPEEDCGEIDRLIEEHIAQTQARLQSLRELESRLSALRKRCGMRQAAGQCGILHALVTAARCQDCRERQQP